MVRAVAALYNTRPQTITAIIEAKTFADTRARVTFKKIFNVYEHELNIYKRRDEK